MSNVVSLDAYRAKKAAAPKQHTHTLDDILPDWVPSNKRSVSEGELRQLIVKARIHCYECASYPGYVFTDDEFKRRWPLFITGLDEFEQRGDEWVTRHMKYRNGCRPSQALWLKEEREALGELLKRNKNFWRTSREQ